MEGGEEKENCKNIEEEMGEGGGMTEEEEKKEERWEGEKQMREVTAGRAA